MKKIAALIVSATIAVAGVLNAYWLFFSGKKTAEQSAATSNQTQTATSSTAPTSATTTETETASSSSSATSSTGKYKDGTFTGSSVSTQWGDVQVQVTISGGKITAVNVLEYPSDNNRSASINEQVLPTYKQETISANSANIQAVSGATVTFGGYTSSLQSALDQAV